MCIKTGDDHLAAITADRAVSRARDGDNPLALAESYRMVSSAYRRHGRYDRATDIAVRATDLLRTTHVRDQPGSLSVQGNLYATAAYTAAKAGDRDSAHDLLAQARSAANRLGQDTTTAGFFGPSQVALHEVSIHHLLGDAGAAIATARAIDTRRLPPERQARLWIDVARAYDQWGKPEPCYRALLAAEQAAPQEARRGPVRDLVAALRRHDRVLPGVRSFATRIGA